MKRENETVGGVDTVSGVHIALIVVAMIISIPMFLAAAEIGGSLGVSKAIPVFLTGSVVLCVLGSLTSVAGMRHRSAAYGLIERAFGKVGAMLANLVIAVSLVGWYAVTMKVFGQAADNVVYEMSGVHLPVFFYIIGGSALMVWIAVKGFTGIDKLSLLMVPLMLFFLLYAVYLTIGDIDDFSAAAAYAKQLSFSDGVSAVIGSYIVGVVILPDYSRFCKDIRHTILAIVVSVGFVFPLLFSLAAIPSIATGELDLIKIMLAIGIGVPAFLLLLLGSWTTNVVGLYSSSLSLATIFGQDRVRYLIMAVGLLGTLVALTPVQDFFVGFLVTLGVSIPPIAAIYILSAFWGLGSGVDPTAEARPILWGALIAWLAGITLSLLAQRFFGGLTGILSLDSILITGVIYVAARLSLSRTSNSIAGSTASDE